MLLKQIEHISFPNLTYIDLGGNGLNSIEALTRVHLPKLMELGFGK